MGNVLAKRERAVVRRAYYARLLHRSWNGSGAGGKGGMTVGALVAALATALLHQPWFAALCATIGAIVVWVLFNAFLEAPKMDAELRKQRDIEAIRLDLAVFVDTAVKSQQAIIQGGRGGDDRVYGYAFVRWAEEVEAYLESRLGLDYVARFDNTLAPTAFYGQYDERLAVLREIIRDLQGK